MSYNVIEHLSIARAHSMQEAAVVLLIGTETDWYVAQQVVVKHVVVIFKELYVLQVIQPGN